VTVASPEPASAAAGPMLLPPEDVAARLAVSRDQVFKLMREGGLPYVRIGRFYRVAAADLELFVRERRVTGLAKIPVRIRLRTPRGS